jgi:hypothetical protein
MVEVDITGPSTSHQTLGVSKCIKILVRLTNLAIDFSVISAISAGHGNLIAILARLLYAAAPKDPILASLQTSKVY